MDFGMTMDIIILGVGVYMVYWAIQMKISGQIPKMLVGRGFNIEKAKDPQGFIQSTFPFTFGIGILLIIFGAVGALNLLYAHPYISTGISFGVVIIILAYGKFLYNAQMKYFVGADSITKKAKKGDKK